MALLAAGSVVLTVTRDGASAGVGMDDVRAFFQPPAFAHLWFYLLFGVFALYAVNTLLATWRNVSRKWNAGLRAPQFYAAAVIHVSFLVGLLAHLVGGFGGRELGQVTVGPDWTDLGDGRQARAASLAAESHPDGSPKQVWVTLDVREADGRVAPAVVSYNGPLSSGFGSDLFLLLRAGEVTAARLRHGASECSLPTNGSCRLGELRIDAGYMQTTGGAQGSVARVQVRAAMGPRQELWLWEGRPQTLADGSTLRLAGVERRPMVLLRHRHAPGNPIALAAGVILVLGLLLMWRRFLPAAA